MPSRQRQRRETQEGADVDLTPMIDVTFQLIIFFMVVTQITSQENVNLRLPEAQTANEPLEDPPDWFTVHIAPVDDNGMDLPDEFGWFCYGEPQPRSTAEMRAILEAEAARAVPDRDVPGRDPLTEISENVVIVRCDARCPAGEFGRLIELMTEARLYRIQIAILKDQQID